MFRVLQHPSSGVLKTVPATSGTGHTTCTATPLQRGLIGTAVNKYLHTVASVGFLFTLNAPKVDNMIPNNKLLSLYRCYKNWFMIKENNKPKMNVKYANVEKEMKIL